MPQHLDKSLKKSDLFNSVLLCDQVSIWFYFYTIGEKGDKSIRELAEDFQRYMGWDEDEYSIERLKMGYWRVKNKVDFKKIKKDLCV